MLKEAEILQKILRGRVMYNWYVSKRPEEVRRLGHHGFPVSCWGRSFSRGCCELYGE